MNKNVSPAPNSVLMRGSKGFVHIIPLLIVALLLIFGVGYYAYKNGQIKLNPSQKQSESPPSPMPDPTANWKTFSINNLNIEFKLPNGIYEHNRIKAIKGEFKVYEGAGETGSFICATFDNKYVPPRPYSCREEIFGIAAFSKDFTAGRGDSFLDNKGYQVKNGKYLMLSGRELPTDYVEEITNPNQVKILKVKGFPYEYVHDARNPGENRMGALINIKNEKYPGITIIMDLNQEKGITEELFNQILSTFQFTE